MNSSAPPEQTPELDRARSLRAAVSGNILEWFDWTLYAIFSTYLASNFFDDSDPTSALLSTLAVFAVGFVARPFGGLVFGRLADRKGRKFTMVLTMCLMAVASLAIALIPSYESIGVWASFALLIARLTQGLAHGGEAGVSYTYVGEISPRDRRGLWGSSVFTAVTFGVMLATLVAALLTGILGKDDMSRYGWRIAFAIGAVLGLYALFLRRAASESPHFEENSDSSASAPPIARKDIVKIGVLILMLSAGQNAAYYTWATFASAYAISAKGMDPNGAFIASLLAQLVVLALLPLSGHLSDKYGRRTMAAAFGISGAVLVLPIAAILTAQPWTLFVTQAMGLAVWCCASAMYPALMSELVPTRARAMGVGFATSLSVAIFGGTAPYLNTWLTSRDLGWVFSVYVGALCLLSLVAALIMKETKGIDLSTVGMPFRNAGKSENRVSTSDIGELSNR